MALFILEDKDDLTSWDSNVGFIIRAKDEEEARKIANSTRGDEKKISKDFWLDEKYSSCKRLKTTGKSEIILNSFNAG